MFYSQAGQDVWVLEQISNGFFVDVGAHDGVESSNTLALEKVGWKGMCIEPNPFSYQSLTQVRRCMALNAGASDSFKMVDGVRFDRLDELLKGCPETIDYLSIDTDGDEMAVLRGMDFKRFHVKLITIEHNQYLEGPARQEEIYSYLKQQGFDRVRKDVKCLDPNYFGAIYEDWYENIKTI